MTKLPCAELLGTQSWSFPSMDHYSDPDLQRTYLVKHHCRANTFMFLRSLIELKRKGLDQGQYYIEEFNRFQSNLINWRVAFEMAREQRLHHKGLKEEFEVIYELLGDWNTDKIPKFTDEESKDFQIRNISRNPKRLVHMQMVAYDFLSRELGIAPTEMGVVTVSDGPHSFIMWHQAQASRKIKCTIRSKNVPL